MIELYRQAAEDLARVADRLDPAQIDAGIEAILSSTRIALYGVGREGLQLKGFAMRLFHIGLNSAMVGDMTAPRIAEGDLLIVSAGPGHFSTVEALIGVAKRDGARVLCVTAQPSGECPRAADFVITIPAQTMADAGKPASTVLPGGSLYEGAQYILFEAMIIRLRDRLGVTPASMRHTHTNLE